jgi:hypothetical protein
MYQLAAIAVLGIDMSLVKFGTGRHVQLSSLSDVNSTLILSYAVRLVYQFVLSTTKIAVCFFYLRVFTDRTSRYITYGIISYIVLFTIPLMLVQIFQCDPISDAWSILPTKNCPVVERDVAIATGVANIVGDSVLLLFVVPKIRMPPFRFLPLLFHLINIHTSDTTLDVFSY